MPFWADIQETSGGKYQYLAVLAFTARVVSTTVRRVPTIGVAHIVQQRTVKKTKYCVFGILQVTALRGHCLKRGRGVRCSLKSTTSKTTALLDPYANTAHPSAPGSRTEPFSRSSETRVPTQVLLLMCCTIKKRDSHLCRSRLERNKTKQGSAALEKAPAAAGCDAHSTN